MHDLINATYSCKLAPTHHLTKTLVQPLLPDKKNMLSNLFLLIFQTLQTLSQDLIPKQIIYRHSEHREVRACFAHFSC